MKKLVTITLEVDTDASPFEVVTGFRAVYDSVDFISESVPFSVKNAINLVDLVLWFARSKKGE